jgi:glycosyltransferase involved in cell wall biosynthesis
MMLAAARAARAAGVPFVSQPHGTIPVTSNSLWIKRIYDRILLRGEFEGLAALIASHEVERKQALSRGIADECITIIPNGIDPSERDAVPERGSFRRRHGLDPETPLILFLGRINKIKGTDMLVQAFARMKSAKARLAIAGPDDGQLTEVLALIRQYSLANRVILLGILPEVDKLAAFRDADLFVLPSRADSFPLAIMEACLMGTPMVITDRCAISDLVRDRVGEVVPFDADAFACAMERLLTDRALYERYRANAAVLFDENFSVRTVVDQLEELYNRVVAVLATAGGPRAASGYPKSYRR